MKNKTPMIELIEAIKKQMGNAIEEKGFDAFCEPFLIKEKELVNTAYNDGHRAGNYNNNNVKSYYDEITNS